MFYKVQLDWYKCSREGAHVSSQLLVLYFCLKVSELEGGDANALTISKAEFISRALVRVSADISGYEFFTTCHAVRRTMQPLFEGKSIIGVLALPNLLYEIRQISRGTLKIDCMATKM